MKKDDGQYWCDEGGEEFGPYSTENEASEKLPDYSRHLNKWLLEFTGSTVILQEGPTINPKEIKKRRFSDD